MMVLHDNLTHSNLVYGIRANLDQFLHQMRLGVEADGSGVVRQRRVFPMGVQQVEDMDPRAQPAGGPGGVVIDALGVG